MYHLVEPQVTLDDFYDDTNELSLKVTRAIYYNSNTSAFGQFGLPEIWIKGNSIFDEGNNAITHWFEALITWALEIDMIPRIDPVPHQNIEGFAVQRKRRYRTRICFVYQTYFTNPWPQKPQAPVFKSKYHNNVKLTQEDLNTYGTILSDVYSAVNEVYAYKFSRGFDKAVKVRRIVWPQVQPTLCKSTMLIFNYLE